MHSSIEGRFFFFFFLVSHVLVLINSLWVNSDTVLRYRLHTGRFRDSVVRQHRSKWGCSPRPFWKLKGLDREVWLTFAPLKTGRLRKAIFVSEEATGAKYSVRLTQIMSLLAAGGNSPRFTPKAMICLFDQFIAWQSKTRRWLRMLPMLTHERRHSLFKEWAGYAAPTNLWPAKSA